MESTDDRSTTLIDGRTIAAEWRDGLESAVTELEAAGVSPTLATVLVADDHASEEYMDLKHREAEAVGVRTRDVRLPPGTSPETLESRVTELNRDPDSHGIFIQMPLPDGIDVQSLRSRIDPVKDVEGLSPENLGRLVRGSPRYLPPTPGAIEVLMGAYDIDPSGSHVVIVGRTDFVGRPLANLLVSDRDPGNATVTVCHTRTGDLESKTSVADVLISSAGVLDLIDGTMVKPGVTVFDVGATRVSTEDGHEYLGDVDFESVAPKASAITPFPGGVGPVTRVSLLANTIEAASTLASVPVEKFFTG
ncbi:MAG: bifunctional 5,10-methylenetetrahydrofolate dehydrogenase/5,10-methenyltetrahydrofolate cyclohydrolase [Halodesulfurarchaeum sp.]